jgi:hypothetical protein
MMSGADVASLLATDRSRFCFTMARIVVVCLAIDDGCYLRRILPGALPFQHTQDGCLLHFPVLLSCMSFVPGVLSGDCMAFPGFLSSLPVVFTDHRLVSVLLLSRSSTLVSAFNPVASDSWDSEKCLFWMHFIAVPLFLIDSSAAS